MYREACANMAIGAGTITQWQDAAAGGAFGDRPPSICGGAAASLGPRARPAGRPAWLGQRRGCNPPPV